MKQFIFISIAFFALLFYSPCVSAFDYDIAPEKTEICTQIFICAAPCYLVENLETTYLFHEAENPKSQIEKFDFSKYFVASQKNKDNLSFYWYGFINNLPCLKGRLYNTINTKISHDKESTNHYKSRKIYISYWCDFYCRA